MIGWCHHCMTFQRWEDAPVQTTTLTTADGEEVQTEVERLCVNAVHVRLDDDHDLYCDEPWTFGIHPVTTERMTAEECAASWDLHGYVPHYVPCAERHIGESFMIGDCGCPEMIEAQQLEREEADAEERNRRSAAAKKAAMTRRLRREKKVT